MADENIEELLDKAYRQGFNDALVKVRVGLGKVNEIEIETESEYKIISFYRSNKVLSLLDKLAKETKE